MTFKQLTNELINQGWRVYHIDDLPMRGSRLQSLAIRSLIEVQIYEGRSLVFVKTVFPKKDNNEKSN